MNRLVIDFHSALANIDILPFFVVVSGIILFWVVMVWILFFILGKMQ
jgi:hypothetical protein